jgi:hypothetical protein
MNTRLSHKPNSPEECIKPFLHENSLYGNYMIQKSYQIKKIIVNTEKILPKRFSPFGYVGFLHKIF